jgi:riboflavin synthase
VVNGVSLTVNKTEDTTTSCLVDINIIPHTLENTTLGKLQQGNLVNLEIDLIARYVARMLETQAR